MIDYHTHSRFSYDNGPVSMDEMIRYAIAAGLTHIAITDHYDPFFPSEPAELDFPRYMDELARIKEEYGDKINIAAGVEIGMQMGYPLELCAKAVSKYKFDFVIASVHSACGFSMHTPEFTETRTPAQSKIDYYSTLLDCITEFDDFNVLGHLNVIDRYTPVIGKNDEVDALVREIFEILVSRGQGIEVNTSFLRAGRGATSPPEHRFREFAAMGGTVVTTASDAHNPLHIGAFIPEAEDLLRATGFPSVTVFSGRKGTPLPL